MSPMAQGANAAQWLSSAAGVATLAVAIVALIAAKGQLGEAKESRKQARVLDRARSRPYVVVFMQPSRASNVIIDLVVRNFGSTAAHDVRIAITPEPERAEEAGPPGDDRRLALPSVIRTLAPGQEWRVLWDTTINRKGSSLPAEHEAIATYDGLDGAELSSRSLLDWGTYAKGVWAHVYSTHDVAKSVDKISKTAEKWTEGINSGLSVVMRDGAQRDRRQRDDARRRGFLEGADPDRVTPARKSRRPH